MHEKKRIMTVRVTDETRKKLVDIKYEFNLGSYDNTIHKMADFVKKHREEFEKFLKEEKGGD